MSDYTREIKLKHNEIPAKINVETGEIKAVGGNEGRPSSDSHKFDLMPTYQRRSTKAWEVLKTQTTDAEYKVADILALKAQAYTNSLIPLNDETTITELADALNVSRNRVLGYVDKLFKLGVIAKFEVYEHKQVYHKYWVFNPYLSFNGKSIKKDIPTLFDGTTYALIAKNSK